MTARFLSDLIGTVLVVKRQRIEQTINGRTYQIEVSPVAVDRWRAQLLRQHGGPSAMMPFYGATADEAAELLSHWLLRAQQCATPNP